MSELWVSRQPRVVNVHHGGEFRECACGQWHSAGSKAIVRHRDRLIVTAVEFGWPLGRVDFVKAR